MQKEVQSLQKTLGGVQGEKKVVEDQKQMADKSVTELQVVMSECGLLYLHLSPP